MFRRFKPLGVRDDEHIEIDERDMELEELHVKKSGMDAWRKRNRILATKPIYKKDFPHLYACMVEDGLDFTVCDGKGTLDRFGTMHLATCHHCGGHKVVLQEPVHQPSEEDL
jgi:predicted transcriptional regulator